MNKSKFICAIIIAVSFFTQMNISFAQDLTNSKTSEEEFTAFKKGNFAFYLEFGSMLFKSASSSYSNELLLTAKYHLSDKTALRVSGGTDLHTQSGIYNRYDNGTFESWMNYGDNNSSFNASINIQHFFSTKSKIKPFYSIGVYAKYLFTTYSSMPYWGKREEWGVGPFASFGAEFFVLDNISIIGEYLLRGTAGKDYQKTLEMDFNNNVTSETYLYSTVYNLDLKSFRAGLSIYF